MAGIPAFTVAAGLTMNVTALVTMPQGPKGSLVLRVRVTVPLLLAMGVNMTDDGVAVGVMLLS